jgi:hypothetical protein
MGLADSLTLYLPCYWQKATSCFQNNRTGQIANYYHDLFSRKMGGNTLEGITRALVKGATLIINSGGFHTRNLQVGDTDVVLAYTFGEREDYPKDGGTSHCWDNSNASVKIHRRIQDL